MGADVGGGGQGDEGAQQQQTFNLVMVFLNVIIQTVIIIMW